MDDYNDYEIPFDDMSEQEFLYRAMNPDDPMYMGPDEDGEYEEYDDEAADDYDG